MAYGSVIKALIARVIFGVHGFLTIWQAVELMRDSRYWWLTLTLIGLLIETLISVCGRGGKEKKWFCPSVFLYLCSVVPATWFIELDLAHRRHDQHLNQSANFSTNSIPFKPLMSRTMRSQQIEIAITKYLKQMQLPITLSYEMWAQVLEQLLLVNLILGRWLLPKGELTRDQLSQLLLVYIGMAADIVEFFEAFKEPEVRYNLLLCQIILAIWSWSLLQFTVVITASRARRSRYAWSVNWIEPDIPRFYCFNMDVWAITTTILLQDGPFFCLRVILILRYGVVSYMNIFFTCKNALVLVLQLYRMVVVLCQNGKEYQRLRLMEERHRLSAQHMKSGDGVGVLDVCTLIPPPLNFYDNYAYLPLNGTSSSSMYDNIDSLITKRSIDGGSNKSGNGTIVTICSKNESVDRLQNGGGCSCGRKRSDESNEFINIVIPKQRSETRNHNNYKERRDSW